MNKPGKRAVGNIDRINFSAGSKKDLVANHSAGVKDSAGRLERPEVFAGIAVHRMEYSRHRADEDFPIGNNRLHTGHQALIAE
ncbi:hypothetical protein ES703_69447 [subsurface metagenome]